MDQTSLRTQPPFSEAVKDFRSGASTPRKFLENCIEAIEKREPTVKAFVHKDLDQARAAADAATKRYAKGEELSSIDGMPVGVKDIINTRNLPTEMNSEIFANHTPITDAACVHAMYAGGAYMVGKTVTTEFAIARSGPTTNPHNAMHTPGGSSSGSAAGTAAGMFAAGFGTQTQGSVIRPASFCGVVGFKPTIYSLSIDGIHPLSKSHDHLGVLADSVDDAWSLARWVGEHAPEESHPGLAGPLHGLVCDSAPAQVGVLRTTGFNGLDDATLTAFEKQLETLSEAGVKIVEPKHDPVLQDLVDALADIPQRSLELLAYEMRWPFSDYIKDHPDLVGERIHKLVTDGHQMTRDHYYQLLLLQKQLRAQLTALIGRVDALILPAASEPAPKGFEFTGSRELLVYSSFLGAPAFSVPTMQVNGMPLGLQLVGFHGQDYALARQAKWIATHQ